MKIVIQHKDNTLTVSLDGALDYKATVTMEGLIHDMQQIKAARVVFDMSKIERVDSVGLGMLHLAKDEIIESGAKMVLRGASGNVKRLFELTDSQHSFEIE
ncbi:Anti-anti-sigma regulatory factor [Candidatus Terasakiella magnetica]|nr:Anti-anti-sigma regulatory factor [Candidatus Terasakiella magnetica]